MARPLPSLAFALALLVAPAHAAAPVARTADRDCADFANQRDAQNYYASLGGPRIDPDRLDADDDGRACDSLPCPCGASRSTPRRPTPAPAPRKRAQVIQARVTRVTDGDTVKVRAFGARRSHYTVRLIGIDTPEKYGGTECGSAGASRHMRRIALDRAGRGRRVVLTPDPTQDTFDRYGRLLAYVRTTTGNQLNVAQVAAGWAKTYVYGGKPFQQVARFRAAERRAKAARRGVWRRCGGNFHRGRAAAAVTKRYCGVTMTTASTGIRVWRAGPLTCSKAKRVMRSHIVRGRTWSGWSCPDSASAYYCRKLGSRAKAWGVMDTIYGE